MNKIVLLAIAIITCASFNAQEPEKKKEAKTPNSDTQERAINQSGISVKSKPQTKTSAKEVEPVTPSNNDKKLTEEPKAVKKPD